MSPILLQIFLLVLTSDLTELREPLVAPLMPLTERFPIGLTSESRYLLADLEKKEPARNIDLFQERSFSWLGWLILILGGVFAWNYRPIPSKPSPEEEKQLAEKQLRQSFEELKTASDEANLSLFYEKLLAHLRLYFEKFYPYRIESLTTEEFLQRMGTDEKIPTQVRKALQDVLIEGDKVRFGRHESLRENVQKALQLIKEHFLYV